MIKQYLKLKKFSIVFLSLGIISCTSQAGDYTLDGSGIKTVSSANLGPKGGGSIDPKVRQGYTLIGLGNGTSNLTLRLKVASAAGSSFQTKAESQASTKTGNEIASLANELGINGEKFKFDIPYNNLNSDQHEINLSGLKKGDVVDLDSKALDKSGKVVGQQTIKDKKVTKDDETVDVNISVSIGVNVTQTVTQTVTQNQTVNVAASTPNIIINLPSPPSMQPPQSFPTPPPQQQPPQSFPTPPSQQQPVVTTPVTAPTPVTASTQPAGGACLRPDQNFMVTLSDGKTKVQVCPPPNQTQISGCNRPDPNQLVTLANGTTFTICKEGQ